MKTLTPVAKRLITAELFSDLGNQFVHLTLMAELFFGLSGSLSNLIFLCLIQQVPAILLGPLMGRWIDRIGAKSGLMGAVLFKGLCVVGLFAIGARLPVWGLYFMFMVASLGFYISRLAITARLIPRERLIGYNAMNERVALGASIVGPWLIGLMIRSVGNRPALSLGVGMFLGAALLVRGLPQTAGERPEPEVPAKIGGWRRIRQAYLAPLLEKGAGTWFGLIGILLLCGGIINFGGPIFNKSFFAGDIAIWGAIMSGHQAGACLATIILPAVVGRFGDRAVVALSFAALGMGFGLVTLFQWLPLFIGVMTDFGCGFTLLLLFLESRIQRDCARNRLGRTMAALSALRAGALLTGILSGALLVNLGGVRVLMALGALVLVFGALKGLKIRRMPGKNG